MTGLEKFLVYGLNFVQSVVLARLLTPDDFGLTAMLGLFLALAGIFADSGLGVALIQDRAFTRRDERQVLSFGLAVAGCLYLVLFAVAPWIAAFYHEPRLVGITRVLALTIVLNAPNGIASARLQRTERFGLFARVNIFAAVLIAATSVFLAWRGFGVWTLVWANVAGSAVRTVSAWAVAWGIAPPNGNDDARGGFSRLLRYGWKLAASYLLSTVYGNIIPMVIGKLQTSADVGLYARASSWSALPGGAVGDVVGRVAFPGMARARDDVRELRRIRRRYAWLGLALLCPALAVLGLFARPIITLVFGAQWLDAVAYLRILIVGAACWPLTIMNAVAMGACGRSDLVLKSDLVRRPMDLAVVAFGCCFGIEGLCWAKVVADVIDWMVIAAFARKMTGAAFWKEALAL